jgi:hypothetical protein
MHRQQVRKKGTMKKGVAAYRSISDETAIKAFATLAVPAVIIVEFDSWFP